MYFCDMMCVSVSAAGVAGTMFGIGEERRLLRRGDLRRRLAVLGISRVHEVDVRRDAVACTR